MTKENSIELKKSSERWVVNFHDHKPHSFHSKEDMEKYLNNEESEEYGYMEYERVPDYVEHIVCYDIDYKIE